MTRTTVVTALVAAVVFAVAGFLVGTKSGNLVPRHKHDQTDCTAKDECPIKINVDCALLVVCEPYPEYEVVLTKSDKKEKKLAYTIDQTTYEFDSGGIQFTSLNDGDKYFTCSVGDTTKQYNCKIDKDTKAALYKYRILVKGLDPVDPWIINY